MPPKRIRASPQTSPSPLKRKRCGALGAASPATPRWTQLALDVGQRDVSATKCADCGMVYAPGADDEAHDRFHRSAERSSALKLTPAAIRAAGIPVRVSRSGAKLFILDYDAPAALAARKAVTQLLGANNGNPPPQKCVLAVTNARVVGYCAFERVHQAEICAIRASDASVIKVGKKPIVRPLCGVRLIWVNEECRRKGVANAMLDVVRRNSAYAHVFHRSSVAFTAPTQAGARFAAKYAPLKVKQAAQSALKNGTKPDEGDGGKEKNDKNEDSDEDLDRKVLAYILVYNAALLPSSNSNIDNTSDSTQSSAVNS